MQGCQPATLAERHDPEAGGVTYRMAVGFTETVYEVAYRAQPARGRLPRHPLIPDRERRYVGGVHHPAERDPPSGYVRLRKPVNGVPAKPGTEMAETWPGRVCAI